MQPRLKVEKHCFVLLSTELIILFTDLMMDHLRKLQPTVSRRMFAKNTAYSAKKYACKRYSLQCHEVCLQKIQPTVSWGMLAKIQPTVSRSTLATDTV